jgi:cytochrome c-type biogenesis protein CcmH
MTAMRSRFALAIIFLLHIVPAFAVAPDEMLKDPALEARARALSQQLRCMVCQNQSIDDSDAPLAHDLRVLVRERLTHGDSDTQVIDFLVARYGEFVLLKPRFAWHNALLWAIPPAILMFGAVALFVLSRRRRIPDAQATLDEAEQRKLAAILQTRGDENHLAR